MSAGTPVSAQAPWNVLSVVSFVLALVGFNVIAIILGVIGLSQIKARGERGRGFAIAGIIIGAIAIVVLVIVVIVAVTIGSAGFLLRN